MLLERWNISIGKLQIKRKAYSEISCHECREYPDHCFIIKWVDGNDIEVTQEARCDGISTSTRGTHSSKELDVLQNYLGCVLCIIPERRSSNVLLTSNNFQESI